MPAIYISYRKEDAYGEAAHLYKDLPERFGKGAVFVDVARRQPGRDYRQVIEEHVASSAVTLVLIGKAWAGAKDALGQRRLDNPQDPVRIEIAAALKRNIPVVPVLVHGAGMVQPADLPPDLADLAFRSPVKLTQEHWGSDVDALATSLQTLVLGSQGVADAAAGAPSEAATKRPRGPAAVSTSTRGPRGQPSSKAPWALMLVGAAVVFAVPMGVYKYIDARDPPVGQAVADAQGAAATATAKAEEAQADAKRTQALAASTQAQAELDTARAQPQPQPQPTQQPPPAQNMQPPAGVVNAASAPAGADKRARAGASAAPAARPVAPEVGPAKPAVAEAAADAPLTDPAASRAKTFTMTRWTLNSGGCGAGSLSVTGAARFSIEKTAEGILVTEEFRGSGKGIDAVVSGRAMFSKEQRSYEIPTRGQWSGAKVFSSSGIDRVSAANGTQPTGASVVKLQSICG
jgi:hypothetical protein